MSNPGLGLCHQEDVNRMLGTLRECEVGRPMKGKRDGRKHIGLVPEFVMDTTEKSGIDFFSVSTVDQVVRASTEYRFTIFVSKQRLKEFSGLPDDVHVVGIPKLMAGGFLNILWYLSVLPICALWYRIDLLHLFAGNRRMTWFPADRTLVTVHDVFHFHQKGIYTLAKFAFFRGLITPLLKRQKHFHTISGATQVEMQRFLGVSPEMVHVAHPGVPKSRVECREAKRVVRDVFGIDRPYLLYVSALDHPRKNHVVLLDAYESLLRKRVDLPDLLFAGPDFFRADVIHREIASRQLSGRVRALGYVPDSLLPGLYQEATMFVHPSTLEGFGYPLVEAMMFGLPVACADIDVFREIGGDVPVYFDARSPEDIASKIEAVLDDTSLRKELSQRGKKRAEQFCLDRCSSEVLKIYERVLSQQSGCAD